MDEILRNLAPAIIGLAVALSGLAYAWRVKGAAVRRREARFRDTTPAE
jgi:hypothetical protein